MGHEVTFDERAWELLQEMVGRIEAAAATVAGQADLLMASAGVNAGDEVTLYYHQYHPNAPGQQWMGGKLIGCLGSWVCLERHDNGQPTWRNLALIETLVPGLPEKQQVGRCQKCKNPFRQASKLEVFCPNCSGGGSAVGEA